MSATIKDIILNISSTGVPATAAALNSVLNSLRGISAISQSMSGSGSGMAAINQVKTGVSSLSRSFSSTAFTNQSSQSDDYEKRTAIAASKAVERANAVEKSSSSRIENARIKSSIAIEAAKNKAAKAAEKAIEATIDYSESSSRAVNIGKAAADAQKAIQPAETGKINANLNAAKKRSELKSAVSQYRDAKDVASGLRDEILATQGQLLDEQDADTRKDLNRHLKVTRHERNLAMQEQHGRRKAVELARESYAAATKDAKEKESAAQQAHDLFDRTQKASVSADEKAKKLGVRAARLGTQAQIQADRLIAVEAAQQANVKGVTARANAATASTANAATAATAEAESAAAAARNAALMQSLANPLIMLTAAVVGGYVAWRELQVHIKALDREMAHINTTVIGVRAEITAGDTLRNAKMGLQLSNTTTQFDDSSRLRAFTQENRGNTESRIRAEQAGSTRDYAGRQEIREREERSQSLVERGNEARFKSANTATQQAELDNAQKQFAEDKVRSKDAFDKKISALNKEKLEPPKQSKGATAAMGAVGGALALTPLGGLTSAAIGATLGGYASPSLGADVEAVAGGGMTTSQVGVHNAKLDAEGLREQLERKKQLAKEAEIEAGFAAKSVELGRDKSKSAAEQLNTLREATKEARKNFEQDKEKIAENRRTVGGMTPGMRTRMKNIEAKRLRMMQPGNTETFNQSELELPVPEGTKAAAAMRKQREQQGLEGGKDILEQDIDIKKSEAEAKATEAAQAAGEPDLVQQIKDTGAKEEGQVKELIKTIQSSYMATKAFDDLEATFKALDEIIKSRIAALKRWV